ncbi:MAG TPA: cupin domain-containing protein [Oceanobacillus sp.]|nr:cupin domain-containing protein [Oceanobacillus sp.]
MNHALRMPGATLLTRLKVYDTVTPDGQRGGTPHFHFLCTEMYFVLNGTGAVEMIDGQGFSRVDLKPHSALVFTPGTIHRLINPNGDLEILVIMQNSGLPERGDNIVCFTDEWLADKDRYTEAMTVKTIEDAYRRRDRGVEGFLQLKAAFEDDPEKGCEALRKIYRQASLLVDAQKDEWGSIIEKGALTEADVALQRVDLLKNHEIDYLFGAQHFLIEAQNYSSLGFCGHLNRYFDPATLMPEGVRQE